MIYLDYQATTPVAPEVIAAMRPWIEEKFANPHSPSTWGREAAAAMGILIATRSFVPALLGIPLVWPYVSMAMADRASQETSTP